MNSWGVAMTKRFVFTLLALSLMITTFALGCGASASINNRTIDDLMSFFDANGMKVESTTEQWYWLINASDGRGLVVDGGEIEIYKYDLSDESAKNMIDKMKKTGESPISMFDQKLPVVVNGPFALTGHETHPSREKIVEVFKKF